ncbi:MAG: HAD family phosphatase [Muribaculaceae bacterium]|nr:HAD family phosphatase [Muribaculaceae bacterium]
MKSFLFDLDGVLIDSEGLYTRFWAETEKEFPTGIDNFATVIKGTNLKSIMNYFSEEDRPKILAKIYEFDSNLTYKPFPDAENFLRFLKEKNVKTALVTSSNTEKMDQFHKVLPSFRSYFDVIIDGSMVSRGKPDPEGYLLAAKAIGEKPENCIVVEDSLQGIMAGKNAGAEVWGLYTTLPREVIAEQADRIFQNISEVYASLA